MEFSAFTPIASHSFHGDLSVICGKSYGFAGCATATSEIAPFWPISRLKLGNAGRLYRLWILVGANFVRLLTQRFSAVQPRLPIAQPFKAEWALTVHHSARVGEVLCGVAASATSPAFQGSSLPTTRPVTVCSPDGRLRSFATAGVIVLARSLP